MSAVVIASTIAGMLTGERSRAGVRPIRITSAGVIYPVVAMGLLAIAGK